MMIPFLISPLWIYPHCFLQSHNHHHREWWVLPLTLSPWWNRCLETTMPLFFHQQWLQTSIPAAVSSLKLVNMTWTKRISSGGHCHPTRILWSIISTITIAKATASTSQMRTGLRLRHMIHSTLLVVFSGMTYLIRSAQHTCNKTWSTKWSSLKPSSPLSPLTPLKSS